jgi:hypothetical protein
MSTLIGRVRRIRDVAANWRQAVITALSDTYRPELHCEVIGERVRDKIAASKRKGIWVGGPVRPGVYGYDQGPQLHPRFPLPARMAGGDKQ